MQASGCAGAKAAGLDAEVAPAAAKRAAIQPYAWLRSWRFAWIPAAALAASVALAVFVHMRHVEQSAEMAKNEHQRVTPDRGHTRASSAAGAGASCAASGCARARQVPGAKFQANV